MAIDQYFLSKGEHRRAGAGGVRAVTRGTWVTARMRAANRIHDLIDRWIHGRCCTMPSGLPTSPGYHFWRCGLKRGHDGAHRSVNYVWWEWEKGIGRSLYLPVDSPPPGCDRRPVRTLRQARASKAWHAARDAERATDA